MWSADLEESNSTKMAVNDIQGSSLYCTRWAIDRQEWAKAPVTLRGYPEHPPQASALVQHYSIV